MVRNIFTDFKRHDLGPAFHERNYDGRPTATELVRRGYVVISIDAFMFGERRTILDADLKHGWDRSRYGEEEVKHLNQQCRSKESTLVKALTFAGLTWPGVVAWDDMRTVDYLVTRPEVDAKRVGCMGISMGGAIAQELVLKHPERVDRLVLGCTSPGPGDEAGVAVGGPGIAAFGEAVASGDPAVAARIMWTANVSAAFAAVPGHFEEFERESRAVRVPGPVVVMQVTAAFSHDAIDRLDGVATPTLVVHGTEDAIMLPSAGEWLASLIPDAKLELLEGVGHLFFWEQPERTAELGRPHRRSSLAPMKGPGGERSCAATPP